MKIKYIIYFEIHVALADIFDVRMYVSAPDSKILRKVTGQEEINGEYAVIQD